MELTHDPSRREGRRVWAAPWLADVAGLHRAAVVEHLTLMALALAASALLLGAIADRLRRAGVRTELILAGTLALSMLAQLALLLGLPVPSHLAWVVIAAAGAATVLSFSILAQYFPKQASGRANSALGVLHVGAAFGLQSLAGLIIAQWPAGDGHYPAEAHEAAMSVGLILQLATFAWFLILKRRQPETLMAHAVTRALGLSPSPSVAMLPAYRRALSVWAQHVEHTRRQAPAWRFAAAASVMLCAALAGSLLLIAARPVVALRVVDSSTSARISGNRALRLTQAATSATGPWSLLQPVYFVEPVPRGSDLAPIGHLSACTAFGDQCAFDALSWLQADRSEGE